ncbi:hypothetical protein ABEG18_19970 [Alsobacter sp. KACC 23698]|uniref:NolW-like domain-containing protein n=1 Tax=Alsobacter sp. KACC 23698 TaxID=3149229 RepID=A0AAU7JCE8_9HYPH
MPLPFERLLKRWTTGGIAAAGFAMAAVPGALAGPEAFRGGLDLPAVTGSTGERAAAQASPTPAAAAAKGPEAGFVYVFEQDLRSFLNDYCRHVGLRPDIDNGVRGRLSKAKLSLDLPTLMADLNGRFEIEWYIEGDSLRVAPRSELTTRVISLRSVKLDELTAALKASDVDVARYPMRAMKDADAVIVRAPSSYVSKVLAVLETLGRGNNDGVVRVIRYGAERTPDPAPK